MSMLPMYKRCPNRKRRFSYNPSIGDLGLVCPNCGKPIISSAADKGKQTADAIKKIFKSKND